MWNREGLTAKLGSTSLSGEIGDRWYIDGMKLKKTNRSKGHFPSRNCFVIMTEHKTSFGFCGWYETKKDSSMNLPLI